ncbi:carbohydrate ABC transporter permease [Actinopolymorpha alba]|uniref:carbohydrate ABC transporter permease n=1 Tax=Actinopolymorpha alba TaxID=533267 RepID=UPI00035E2028|nr:carbohydrate ABC transporter permease [Actinopolymorpha alba]
MTTATVGAGHVPPRPRVRTSGGVRTVARYAFLIGAAALTLGPVIWTLWTSITPLDEATNTRFLSVGAYGDVFKQVNMWLLVWNSALVTLPTAFGAFLMRQYFLGLPTELSEAAAIDGAGPVRTFFSIFAPLSAPGLAIVGILAFNYHWNEFFRPLIMEISEENFTLPLGLVTLQGNLGTGSVATVLAGVVLSMLPALAVFIIGNRPLREGLTAGSGK